MSGARDPAPVSGARDPAPAGGGGSLVAVVVVPARDEAGRIGACLAALGAQVGVPGGVAVVVVAHRCTDATAAVAEAAGVAAGLDLEVVTVGAGGVGAARRAGMDRARARLAAGGTGPGGGLIASTDADTLVAPDWLAATLRLVAGGADAVGGRIELDAEEGAALPPAAVAARDGRAADRLAAVRAAPGGRAADHPHFSGASMALTAAAYDAVGGLPARDCLEDEALAASLAAAGLCVARSDAVRVRTSARTSGRAGRGLSVDLAVAAWRATRCYRADELPDAAALRRAKGDRRVSVVVPAREVAATIGATVAEVLRTVDAGLVDEVLVVDAASTDGTAALAEAAGARVAQQDQLLPAAGPCLGKGDAMWRAVSATTGDVIVFCDADSADFDARFVVGTLAPLLLDDGLVLAKGTFARSMQIGELSLAGEGGRVTELAARPLLNLWHPRLAGFDQPLAGEFAIRRELAEAIPWPAGYGVEIGVLIDTERRCGLDALCQVDLGHRQNRHQPLSELSAMAYAVLAAAWRRQPAGADAGVGPMLVPGGGPWRPVPVEERPPLAGPYPPK